MIDNFVSVGHTTDGHIWWIRHKVEAVCFKSSNANVVLVFGFDIVNSKTIYSEDMNKI